MKQPEIDERSVQKLLGIRPNATRAEIDETYRELVRFLSADRVPRRLSGWARLQRDAAERAHRVLTASGSATTDSYVEHSPVLEAEDVASVGKATDGDDRALATRKPRAAPRATGRRGFGDLSVTWRGIVLVAGIILVAIALVVDSTMLAPNKGQTEQASSPQLLSSLERQAPITVDESRMVELSAAVERDPRDVSALFELGEMNFQAGRWEESIRWFTRLVEVDAANVHAWTDIGTSNFDLGRYDLAKGAWEEALARDQSDPQVHYNLGFLYANGDERDLERALQEWEAVVRLAPDSDLARTAQAHIDGLGKR